MEFTVNPNPRPSSSIEGSSMRNIGRVVAHLAGGGLKGLIALFALIPLTAASAQTDTSWTWKDSTGAPHDRQALEVILRQHELWLKSHEKAGHRANLRYAFFSGLDLSHLNLEKVNLAGARLIRTNLTNT